MIHIDHYLSVKGKTPNAGKTHMRNVFALNRDNSHEDSCSFTQLSQPRSSINLATPHGLAANAQDLLKRARDPDTLPLEPEARKRSRTSPLADVRRSPRLNHDSSRKLNMADGKIPSPIVIVPETPDDMCAGKWSCSSCTFDNPPNIDICEMCNKPREADAAEQEPIEPANLFGSQPATQPHGVLTQRRKTIGLPKPKSKRNGKAPKSGKLASSKTTDHLGKQMTLNMYLS